MTRPSGNARIAAVIVAFGPDALQINTLIGTLACECEAIYVMDNGGGAAAIGTQTAHAPTLRVIDMGGNAGIGRALNAAFEYLTEADFDYVTTFDQDSEPAPGQITKLVEAFEELTATGVEVAAVGPRVVDRRGACPVEHPFMGRVAGWPTPVRCKAGWGYVETDFLITSGSVISMDAYRRIGRFDAGLFVDYTDVDWCLRARQNGYRLMGICAVMMTHELSAGDAQKVLGVNILRYSPVRRYYYARNTVLLIRRPHVAFGWKARLLLGLAFRVALSPLTAGSSGGRTCDWVMMCKGIAHGVRKRDGALAAVAP
jgi:rhamnosyltransferase